MRPFRLHWKLYPAIILITLLALLSVTSYTTRELERFYLEHLGQDLHARLILLESLVEIPDSAASATLLDDSIKRMGRQLQTRFTVIRMDGVVVADSDHDPMGMENHGTRPEITEALAGGKGSSQRYSETLRQTMMYVAIPLRRGGRITGAVRAALPLTSIQETLNGIYGRIALGALAVAVLAAGVSLLVSRHLTRPLEELRRGAMRFARGELDHKVIVPDSREFGAFAETLNQMAAQLDERIRTVVQQRNEREAILRSMIEGVLAIDMEERLISLNRAAAELLGADPDRSPGRGLEEITRDAELRRFVRRTLESQEPIQAEFAIHQEGGALQISAHGTVLRDSAGQASGAVVVLQDLTELRHLEKVRKDFVANVSHELKTPITSIQGFVETLLDGALDERTEAERFLRIIASQAGRLSSIIEDLLSLSRIEQQAEKEAIPLVSSNLREPLETAIQACALKAEQKGVALELQCPETLTARINTPLIEQALVNLIDNAIKYSDSGWTVTVDARQEGGECILRVIDRGCGIPPEHQERIFERFYRVDRARSRELGGTGLGLSIVRNIVRAHGGTVAVESRVGQGSIFSIHLPAEVSDAASEGH